MGEDYPPAAYDAGVSAAAITVAGVTTITLGPAPYAGGYWPRFYRVSWTVAGTAPSFTLAVTADN